MAGMGAYSKAAQELLQKKFAGTTWAAQTPYWFDCMNQEWPSDPNATEQGCHMQAEDLAEAKAAALNAAARVSTAKWLTRQSNPA